jgi:hypothetical protein
MHASDGAVPAGALTTGPSEQSEKWRTRFENEVVADAQRRGLSREALDSVVVMALTAAHCPGPSRVVGLGVRGGPRHGYVRWIIRASGAD